MMKKSLLAAASAAAITIGGTASAVDLTVANLGATAAGATIPVAAELDFASTPVAGTVAVLLNTQGTLPSDNNVLVTLTLTGPASFSAPLTGAEVTNGDDMVAPDNAIVSVGGGAGGTSVTYIIDAGVNETSIGFALPVNITGCGAVGVTLDSISSQGNPIEGGVATLQVGTPDGNPSTALDMAGSSYTCADSYQLAVASDAATNDTQLELVDGFTKLGDALVPGDEQLLSAPVGTITSTLVAANELTGATAGANFAAGNIAGVDFVLQFEDLTNIDLANTKVGPVACTQIGMTTQVQCLNVQEAALTGGATVTVAVTGTGPVAQQDISVITSTANLTAVGAEDLVASTPEAVGGLDRIQFEGQNFGPFDWARDNNGPVNHIFRITGLPSAADVKGVVTVNNSSGSAGALDGTYNFTIAAADIVNGTHTMTSRDVATDIVGGDFGQADLTFTFFTSNPLDVDRFISSGGIVSTFGDSCNDSDVIVSGGGVTTTSRCR
ncbi:MAG: hypothetical protein Tsb0010_14040 [Parvularculaceae bacterium]